MPIKHQTSSYRIINGVKYICWQDIPHKYAVDLKRLLTLAGIPSRKYNIDDGMVRVFIPENTDLSKPIPFIEF